MRKIGGAVPAQLFDREDSPFGGERPPYFAGQPNLPKLVVDTRGFGYGFIG